VLYVTREQEKRQKLEGNTNNQGARDGCSRRVKGERESRNKKGGDYNKMLAGIEKNTVPSVGKWK
jgi:hypothetical protein